MHIHSILSITPLELKFVNISTIEHFREYPYSFLLAFFGFGRIKKELCSINQVIEY